MTLLPPCSPFGPVPALLPFPFQGRYQLQYPPSPGSWFHIAAFPIPAQDCAEESLAGLSQFDFYENHLFWVPEVTLRLPVIPFVDFSQGVKSFIPSNYPLLLRATLLCFRHDVSCVFRAQL